MKQGQKQARTERTPAKARKSRFGFPGIEPLVDVFEELDRFMERAARRSGRSGNTNVKGVGRSVK